VNYHIVWLAQLCW